MTEAIRSYLLSVVAISLLSSILLTVTPKGSVRKTLTFLCGLAMILVTLGPVAKMDFDRMAQSLAKAQIAAEEAASGVTIDNQELVAELIKEKSETYILDKAEDLGFWPSVEVTVQTDAEYPYPYQVKISGRCTEAQRQQLTRDLEQNLAIPAERQEWNTYEEKRLE